ncbi:MAG: hypothetical protein ACK47B_03960 [Armatimonadota bacterium]
MVKRLVWLFAAAAAAALPLRAHAEVTPAQVAARIRPAYLLPAGFNPAQLRYPLRPDPRRDLEAARAALAQDPTGIAVRMQLARAAEAAADPSAPREWRIALGLVDAQVKRDGETPALLELLVECLIGGGPADRAASAAEKLAKLQGDSWKVQMLLGDAQLRRADAAWRVLVRLTDGGKPAEAPQAEELRSAAAAARKAYLRAVELAPAELPPHGALLALGRVLPFMASMLPKGLLEAPEKADPAAERAALLALLTRSGGKVAPAWHAAHLFAAALTAPISAAERETLTRALDGLRAEGTDALFLSEARGLAALAAKDWAGARKHLEEALKQSPERRLAAEWLGYAESVCGEPSAQVLERAKARIAAAPRAQDYALLGVLQAEDERAAALDALRKAVELDIDNVNARYNLAAILIQGDIAASEVRYQLEQVWASQPDDLEATFAFLVVQAIDGKTRAAHLALKDLLGQPELPSGLRTRVEATIADLDTAEAEAKARFEKDQAEAGKAEKPRTEKPKP